MYVSHKSLSNPSRINNGNLLRYVGWLGGNPCACRGLTNSGINMQLSDFPKIPSMMNKWSYFWKPPIGCCLNVTFKLKKLCQGILYFEGSQFLYINPSCTSIDRTGSLTHNMIDLSDIIETTYLWEEAYAAQTSNSRGKIREIEPCTLNLSSEIGPSH